MNQIKCFFAVLCGSLAVVSCTPDQEDVFGKTATERSTEEIERVKTLLEGAENGWHMDFYGDLTYGGYNVLLQFKGDSVTIASERAGDYHNAGIGADGKCIKARSHYKLEQSMGVVLSADEYNDVFHYFSMPNNPDYGYKDTGFEGDFEFRIISASADSIIMRGKKHANRIVMTPIPTDVEWEDLIIDAAETQLFIDSKNYTLSGDDYNDQVVAEKRYHTLHFQWRDSIGQLQTVDAPFVSKKDGYHFYRTYEIKGVEIEGILKGESQDRFYLSNNDKMWLYPYLRTLVEQLTEDAWFITYSNLGTYGQSCWDTFRTTFKNRDDKIEVSYAYIGSDGNRFALFMNIDNNAIYEGLKFVPNEDQTEVTLTWSTDESTAAKKNHKRWGLDDALRPFTGGRGHTFVISTDNQRSPSYLLLTDKDDPTNVIKLVDTVVYYPFNY